MKHSDGAPILSDRAGAIQDAARTFASEVMRPVGKALDLLTEPKDVVSETSKLWDIIKRHRKIGLHRIALPGDIAEVTDQSDPKIRALVVEALGTGDAGLAMGLCSDSIPFEIAAISGAHDLETLARAYAGDDKGELVGCLIYIPPESLGQLAIGR